MSRATDDKRIQALLLWLRRERIAITSLQVGAVRIEGVADMALAESAPAEKPKGDVERRTSMWERYGGGALAALSKSETGESAVTEIDE